MAIGWEIGLYSQWTCAIASIFVLLATAAVWSILKRKKSYPPGPLGMPIIGNLLNVCFARDSLDFMNRMAEIYGPISCFWIGSRPVVVLSSLPAIKEAFLEKGNSFNDTPSLYAIQLLNRGKARGILFANGETHIANRKFVLKAMHNLGLRKQVLEDAVREEANDLICFLQEQRGQPLDDTKALLQLCSTNTIIRMCFGSRLSYADENLKHIVHLVDTLLSNNVFFLAENFFPAFRYIPSSAMMKHCIPAQRALREIMKKQVETHRKTFDGTNIRDFIDMFLRAEVQDQENFEDEKIYQTIADFLAAGSESTATVMSWLLLYLIVHPSVQEKARREVYDVLGTEKMPNFKDRDKLVYVEALILEVLRDASIASTSLPRCVGKNINLGEYVLPEDSYVFANIYQAHHDAKYWKDPFVFRPERWISESNTILKHENFLPFMLGRRVCIGEMLARMELFVITTMLLQRFTFAVPKGCPQPSIKAVMGTARSPAPYQICAIPFSK